MQIAFSTRQFRSLCEIQAEAEGELGLAVARKLRARLADLVAVENTSDLVAGNPQEIDGDGIMSVDLSPTLRLLFCSNHNQSPRLDDGMVDWKSVSRIKLLKIESTNG